MNVPLFRLILVVIISESRLTINVWSLKNNLTFSGGWLTDGCLTHKLPENIYIFAFLSAIITNFKLFGITWRIDKYWDTLQDITVFSHQVRVDRQLINENDLILNIWWSPGHFSVIFICKKQICCKRKTNVFTIFIPIFEKKSTSRWDVVS